MNNHFSDSEILDWIEDNLENVWEYSVYGERRVNIVYTDDFGQERNLEAGSVRECVSKVLEKKYFSNDNE